MDVLSRRSLVVLALLVSAAAGVSAGGWSVITLADFPDYAMAGKPLTLTFSVRQHGQTLIGGLKPSVQASTPGAPLVVVRATPASRPGEYTATLDLDRVGDWSIVVDGGFNADDKARALQLDRPAAAAGDSRRVGAAGAVLGGRARRRVDGDQGLPQLPRPGRRPGRHAKAARVEHVKTLLADPSVRRIEMPTWA